VDTFPGLVSITPVVLKASGGRVLSVCLANPPRVDPASRRFCCVSPPSVAEKPSKTAYLLNYSLEEEGRKKDIPMVVF